MPEKYAQSEQRLFFHAVKSSHRPSTTRRGQLWSPSPRKNLAGIHGKEMLMLTDEYLPGAVESIYRHDAYAFVYVPEGSIVEQDRAASRSP
jgi:hypothetical protein